MDYILWRIDRFQNLRNLNSDLYPRKSSGSNEKHFQGVSYNKFYTLIQLFLGSKIGLPRENAPHITND